MKGNIGHCRTRAAIRFLALIVGLQVICLPSVVWAEGFSVGDACSAAGSMQRKDDSAGGYELVCDGAHWQLSITHEKTGKIGIGTAVPTENLTISGVSGYKNGLGVTGNSATGVGMYLENTVASGHKYALFSGGASNGLLGGLGIWDETAAAYRLEITSGGDIGIGTSVPSSQLDVSNDGGIPASTVGIRVSHHASNLSGALIIGAKSRGSGAFPTTVATGDYIGTYPFMPFVSTSHYMATSYFGARVNGTVTATSAPTEFFISTSNVDGSDPFSDGTVRLLVDPSGKVGIGTTTPAVALDVVGDINYTGQLADVSDRRAKDNIRPLEEGQLEKIIQLQGVSFQMKGHTDTELGLIAQEVEPIYPDLVKTTANGTKTMNYIGLIGPLVEAVKEQQREIEDLRAENHALAQRLAGRPFSTSPYNE